MLQRTIERKLSAKIGRKVTFQAFNVSLFSGSVEVTGVRIDGDDDNQPFLTIARVRAEVSIMRAMKGEIAISSLSIEKPIVNFRRDRTGKTNLPRPGYAPADPREMDEDDGKPWKVEIEKALLIDGQCNIVIEAAGGTMRLSLDDLLADLKRDAQGYQFTILIKSIGRHDPGVALGELRGNGSIANVNSLAEFQGGNAHAEFEIGKLRAKVDIAEIRQRTLDASLSGKIDLATAGAMLAPLAKLPSVTGSLVVDIDCRVGPAGKLQINRLKTEINDAIIKLA